MQTTNAVSAVPRNPASRDHVRSVALDLILTILTLGLFNLWVQYRQMQAVNDMIGEKKYSWLLWLILSLVTLGLYHIYHEYRKSHDICAAMNEPSSNEPVISLVLALFGLFWVADAIQQAHINRYYGSTAL